MSFADYVNWVRRAELDRVLPLLKPGDRILEIGAGSGEQARILTGLGYEVEPIDLPQSSYAADRVFAVTDYDGRHFPFPDASFDVVFSSNTLEHIRDLEAIHAEVKRVLKPGGRCIHILPTGSWQFWTIIAAFPRALRELLHARSVRHMAQGLRYLAVAIFPPRHGERGTALLEMWLFRPQWWRRHFRRNGLDIVSDGAVGLFYTGVAYYGFRWSRERRERLARSLGSSTHLFELKVVPSGA